MPLIAKQMPLIALDVDGLTLLWTLTVKKRAAEDGAVTEVHPEEEKP